MYISNNKPISSVLKAYGEQNKVAKTTKSNAASSADAVELSSSAQDFAQVLAALKKTPEVRQEQVAAFKSQIEAGAYRVDARAVADSILKSGQS